MFREISVGVEEGMEECVDAEDETGAIAAISMIRMTGRLSRIGSNMMTGVIRVVADKEENATEEAEAEAEGLRMLTSVTTSVVEIATRMKRATAITTNTVVFYLVPKL